MEIVAGKARALSLFSPGEDDAVRPTSVRARRAFFDSLGDLAGLTFADLFAGSGAMGLEAASRGAETVLFFEKDFRVAALIAKNIARVKHTGTAAECRVIRGEIPPFRASSLAALPAPDIVFADPPYARSMDLLAGVAADPAFLRWAGGSRFFWELPDTGCALSVPPQPWRIIEIRPFGSARFLLLEIR